MSGMIGKRFLPAWRPRRVSRTTAVALHDAGMAGLAYCLALVLRMGGDVFDRLPPAEFALGGALFMGTAAAVFHVQGIARTPWRHTSLNDLRGLLRAVTLTMLLYLPVMFLVSRLDGIPRSFMVLGWILLFVLVAVPRLAERLRRDPDWESLLHPEVHGPGTPVLLIGAAEGTERFLTALRRRAKADLAVVGVLAEKRDRVGQRLHGVRVVGTIGQVADAVARLTAEGARPHRLVLTRGDFGRDAMAWLLDQAEALDIPLARMPEDDDPLALRPLVIEDMLGRPPVVFDPAPLKALVAGRRVLVTGAGGSIGRELARQLALLGPARLVLLDASEGAVHDVDRALGDAFPTLDHAALLADVRDRARIENIFTAERPELVFHAAALKHVPLVEAHPLDGVLTNICGTRIVADASRAVRAQAMVLISSDKAVNPTSIMGATKRVAEQYCQALDDGSAAGTRFLVVRFGNVLGSAGSVVPIFQRQIAAGGPVTVTHPDMARYFMTLREAVALVLQASAMGMEGEGFRGNIFLLDMGKPVRIAELARQMIRLARKDVEIRITGIRPGEKLFEEAFHRDEPPLPTHQDGILAASPRTIPIGALQAFLDRLEDCARAGDEQSVLEDLAALVPEYTPAQDRADAAS